MKVDVKIDGLEQVFDKLAKAELRLLQKASKAAARAAGKEIEKAERALIRAQQGILNSTRMRSGLLAKSIATKIQHYKDTGVAVAVVGPARGSQKIIGTRRRSGKKSQKGAPIWEWPTKIAHLVDRGTKRSRAFPFSEPAKAMAAGPALEAAAQAAEKVMLEV